MRKRPGTREIREAYNDRPVIKRSRAREVEEKIGQKLREKVVHPPGSPEWKKRRQIVWITATALLLAGLVVSYKHPLFGLLAGCIAGSIASVLAELPQVDKVKFPYGLVAAWTGTALLLAFILFLLIPGWHGQAMTYADKLQGVTGKVSQKVTSDLNLTALASNIVEKASEESPEAIPEEDVVQLQASMQEAQDLMMTGANQLSEKTRILVTRFDGMMKNTRSFSGLLYLQSLLLGGGVMLFAWILSQPVPESKRRRKWVVRARDRILNGALVALSWLGTFVLTRFAKGMVMGLLVALGLLAGGIELAWFIGGLAGLFAFFLRPGYLLALLLAFALVPGSPHLIRALLALLGTCVLLFFLEKKIHWYVCLLPTLHAGFTPRVLRPRFNKEGEVEYPRHTFWGTIRKMRRISRLFSTVGAMVSICLMAWAFLPSYNQEKQQHEEIRAATAQVYSGRPEEALKQFGKLVEKYPDHPEILYGRVKAHVEAGDINAALAAAEALAAWQPGPGQDFSLRETIYRRFRGYFFPDYTLEYPGRGYVYIFNNGEVLENNTVLQEIGTRLLELDEDSSIAYRALTHKALNELDADDAILHAEKGLGVDPGGAGWYALKAQAHLLKLDWENVLISCEQALEQDPANEEMQKLKARAAKAHKSKSL